MQISITNVSKKYGNKYALNNFNATFEIGIYGVLGKNGAGKTTLFRCLTGLIQPTNGVIEYTMDGKIINNKKVLENIGYMPQEFGFYPYFKVYDILHQICIMRKIPKKERKEKIEKVLKKVNLLDKKHEKFSSLSGGMKRRLGLAQAIIGEPSFLIVDEPTAGVDPKERIYVRSILNEYAQNHVVLLSTHIIEDIEHICQKLVILDNGVVKYNGDINNLLNECSKHLSEISFSTLSEFQQYAKDNEVFTFRRKNNKILAVVNKGDSDLSIYEPTLEDAYMWVTEKKDN